jgi:hypothetical protein
MAQFLVEYRSGKPALQAICSPIAARGVRPAPWWDFLVPKLYLGTRTTRRSTQKTHPRKFCWHVPAERHEVISRLASFLRTKRSSARKKRIFAVGLGRAFVITLIDHARADNIQSFSAEVIQTGRV